MKNILTKENVGVIIIAILLYFTYYIYQNPFLLDWK